MSQVELGNPKVRLRQQPLQEFIYQASQEVFLPAPSRLPRSEFFAAMLKRRSRRQFSPLSIQDLSKILWFTCKTLEMNREVVGIWQHRCTPSAGGIHPIDVLVLTPLRSGKEVFVYEPVSHSLRLLSGIAGLPLKRLLAETNDFIPIGHGTLIWFVAQFQKTLSKYKHGESLVWRDSGALLFSFCIAAEALRLNCCSIGSTGNPHISQMFGNTSQLRGVGGCVVGGRLQRS